MSKALFRPHGGIVDEDVELPEALDRGSGHALYGSLVGYVGKDRQRLPAHACDLGCNGLDGAAIMSTIDHHRRPRRGKRQGNGAANIAASAGDEGNTPRKFIADGHDLRGLVLASLGVRAAADKDAGARAIPHP